MEPDRPDTVEEPGAPPLLAGVTVDPMTGTPVVFAAPGVMPYALFLKVTLDWLLEQMAASAQQPQILRAPGPLPKFRE